MADTPTETKGASTEEAGPSTPKAQQSPEKSKSPSKTPPTEYMSDPDEDEEITLGAAVAGLSSWFTSTFSSAKEKSTEMLQYLKQDLSEFSETVTEASKELKDKLNLEDTAKTAAQVVATKASIVLDQMSTIFGVGPDDDDEAIVMTGPGPIVDRVKAKIYSLATEQDIFLNDPDDIKAYEQWMLTFDLEQKNKEIEDLMTANPHLLMQYGQLVPEKVSHVVFWHRYYYRVHEICVAEEEARRKELAKKAAGDGDHLDDASNRSDDHSPVSDVVHISEEDQNRLLAEYEEEMKNGSAQHSRRSSGTQLSSSSSGSFAMVTHDAATDEVKVE